MFIEHQVVGGLGGGVRRALDAIYISQTRKFDGADRPDDRGLHVFSVRLGALELAEERARQSVGHSSGDDRNRAIGAEERHGDGTGGLHTADVTGPVLLGAA